MCTNLMLSVPTTPGQSTPQTHVSARCMEMPGIIEQSIYVVPPEQSFPLRPVPFVTEPLTWSNRYGFVGIAPSGAAPNTAPPGQPPSYGAYGPELAWEKLPTFNDGINQVGLGIGALWLEPGAGYALAGGEADQLSFLDFPAWVLGTCAYVTDVQKALLGDGSGSAPAIHVVGPPAPTAAAASPFFVPLHYVVTDSNGASIVVEFVDGETNVYDAPRAVMTNAPTYDWQSVNVGNYDHLTLQGGVTQTSGTAPLGGSGLVGLPGDALPSSRFIRAWYQSKGFTELPDDGTGWLPAPGGFDPSNNDPSGFSDPDQTAVVVAMQLVQMCMGTPYGMLLQAPPAGAPEGTPPTLGDFTMWTSVRDHTNLAYYVVGAFSGVLVKIDLTETSIWADATYPSYLTYPVLPPTGNWCQDVTGDLQPVGAA